MLPNTFESWIYLIVACGIGMFLGRWIHKRLNKGEAESETLRRMMGTSPRKRVSKKERRKLGK